MQVFVSWSGGKDSCLALYRALKLGFKVKCLLSMLDEKGFMSRAHGLSREILEAQAKAIGIPIVYGKASWESYENEFKKLVKSLISSMGIEGGVFGDISIQEHKDWVERVCNEVGIKSFELLWKEKYENLLKEFLNNGFKAIIVSAKADLIEEKWIGKSLNQEFIEYLRKKKIDLCGENGEYHTLVLHGPMFKHFLKILESEKVMKDKYCVLRILKFLLV